MKASVIVHPLQKCYLREVDMTLSKVSLINVEKQDTSPSSFRSIHRRQCHRSVDGKGRTALICWLMVTVET